EERRLVRTGRGVGYRPASRAHEGRHAEGSGLAIELGGLRHNLWQAGRLFAESALVPTALLAGLLHVVGLRGALAAAVGWCMLTATVRWVREGRVPGTLLVCASMLAGRSGIALLTSSAVVYVLPPV